MSREEWIERPYDEGPEELEVRLQRRLGVHVPKVHALAAQIFEDLDEVRHGVGWWDPHPGTKRRILISDYLWQAVHSIQTNLVEAKLHLWQAKTAREKDNARVANVPTWTPSGELKAEMPPIMSPEDELPSLLAAMHCAGFFRAVGSAVDCLSAGIIGVGGLKTNILKADIHHARKAFRKVKGGSKGEKRQKALGLRVDELVADTGPTDWLSWTTDYRNMLVHRARRTNVNDLPLDSVLFDVAQRPIVRARLVPLLHVDPGRSEIEVLLHHDLQQYIEEDGERVMDAILASTVELIDKVAAELETLWGERRRNPSLIVQPLEQWPQVTRPKTTFLGYSPKSHPITADTMLVSPTTGKRLKAAALTKEQRKKWDTFD